MIVLQDVLDYLADSARPWLVVTDAGLDAYPEVSRALATETAAQESVCDIGVGSDDLDEALLRRVACNLARRPLPLAYAQGDEVPTRFPKHDPEVRRLEGPYLKVVVA